MIKSIVAAAVLTIGLAGYAVAQETTTGAPAGEAPMTQEPAPMAPHHHVVHHHVMHHVHHHVHHMAHHNHMMAPAPEAGAPPAGGAGAPPAGGAPAGGAPAANPQ
jgi:hypothetical protein